MAIKKCNPVTPSLRFTSFVVAPKAKVKASKKLVVGALKHSGGRNSQGKISVRHIGGGVKRRYRVIDFKRSLSGSAFVKDFHYDPNRSAYLALMQTKNGKQFYILAPDKLKKGDWIHTREQESSLTVGNALPLKDLPVGTLVHNIELKPGRGAQLVRAAGAVAQIIAKDEKYATIRLPSKEERLVLLTNMATIGQIGNEDHYLASLGKAGRSRKLNIRPAVRGSVMNPCDHPHGGGNGKAPIGHPGPLSPWGKPTLGYKTRNIKKYSKTLILKRRAK